MFMLRVLPTIHVLLLLLLVVPACMPGNTRYRGKRSLDTAKSNTRKHSPWTKDTEIVPLRQRIEYRLR